MFEWFNETDWFPIRENHSIDFIQMKNTKEISYATCHIFQQHEMDFPNSIRSNLGNPEDKNHEYEWKTLIIIVSAYIIKIYKHISYSIFKCTLKFETTFSNTIALISAIFIVASSHKILIVHYILFTLRLLLHESFRNKKNMFGCIFKSWLQQCTYIQNVLWTLFDKSLIC